ncbi:Protein of unknown function [Propionibacterium cyclohexanicum]|uniref:DUF2975 domain-containing protein n=1 Tax=Propionibacterium cyclohexanicum TaxID=64702 RepID=A0A1H9TBT3_9ACTN|nr:DUF2975 domain-containing protein [Propionibacterium cyclohexanicum]SER94249.1 Protein of unknown function [Propionibacterium cyclohexanicum]
MFTLRRILPLLRASLVVLFVLLLVLQTMSFPGQFAYQARQHPDRAWLRWPLTLFTGILIVCVEVVLVCTWRLLGLIGNDRIFTQAALRWVDAIIAALCTGWILAAAGSLWALQGADDPGPAFLLVTALLVGAVVVLVVVVMRELLRRATGLNTELATVI